MMNNEVAYIYSSGNLIEERNTYFYTPYLGIPFISAWRMEREKSIKKLGAPCEPPAYAEVQNDDGTGFALLESLYAGVISSNFDNNLSLLIQRFEVGKRIYKNYDKNLRAIDRDQCHELSLYLRFAEILDEAYSRTEKLNYLNPFLKIMDTLIALQENLDGNQEGRLSRLIRQELQYVNKLANHVGV
jgi:methionyl-tRNA formyltransferase